VIEPSPTKPTASRRYSPLLTLIITRFREFIREPEAVIWTYGFPIVVMAVLGLAFRSAPAEKITVDIQAGAGAEEIRQQLEAGSTKEMTFAAQVNEPDVARQRLRTGKTDLVVIIDEEPGRPSYQYRLDKTRAESRLARSAVADALQEAAGRQDPVPTVPDDEVTEAGSRYIDFVVPGLLGMGLMGGGLWGVGFVIVDMRIRKLLKRFLATPMKRSDFLLAVMLSRLLFMVPEMLIMLLFSRYFFGVVVQGSLLAVAFLLLLGALMFSGIGLLVASRAKTMETVTGLMNLIMVPMWLLSGIFFSSDRFPEFAQPFIKALPLTPVIHSLRAVMLEGASLVSLWPQIALMAVYGVVTFALALKLFRWN
jgi:ABC-type multidrug transport system permease subunit